MKKFLYLFLAVFALQSCEDATEIIQDGELNDASLFTDVANMQLFLNEVYDQVSIQNNILLSSILTDEVAIGSSGFPDDTHGFQVFTTNGYASAIWNNNYRAINFANRLIRGAALVTPTTPADIAQYNNILAQARAIRAFAHFQLLTYFSTDLSDDSAPGVPRLDYVPTLLQLNPRTTNGDVFDLIEDDLLFAENNITMATSGGGSWYFFNTNVINAMRARMYLYRKNYVLAEQYADAVINTSGISLANCTFTLPANFPLTSNSLAAVGGAGNDSFDAQPPAGPQRALFLMDRHAPTGNNAPAYRRMWVDGIQGEAIFSLQRQNNAGNFGSAYNTNSSSFGGGPLFDMTRSLFSLFTQPLGGGAQDFRRWSFVDRSSLIVADAAVSSSDKFTDVLVIDKYPGKTGGHSANDLKVFRISEMYFIKAECRVRANDRPGAAALIQQVRQARNYIAATTVPTPTYATNTEAYADIMLERRKELCFEGHRYIDLKRLGAEAGIATTDRLLIDSQTSDAINPANINITDFRFTLPIPQLEIAVNPMTQNPGYN